MGCFKHMGTATRSETYENSRTERELTANKIKDGTKFNILKKCIMHYGMNKIAVVRNFNISIKFPLNVILRYE